MPQTTHFKKTIIPYPDGYEIASMSNLKGSFQPPTDIDLNLEKA